MSFLLAKDKGLNTSVCLGCFALREGREGGIWEKKKEERKTNQHSGDSYRRTAERTVILPASVTSLACLFIYFFFFCLLSCLPLFPFLFPFLNGGGENPLHNASSVEAR